MQYGVGDEHAISSRHSGEKSSEAPVSGTPASAGAPATQTLRAASQDIPFAQSPSVLHAASFALHWPPTHSLPVSQSSLVVQIWTGDPAAHAPSRQTIPSPQSVSAVQPPFASLLPHPAAAAASAAAARHAIPTKTLFEFAMAPSLGKTGGLLHRFDAPRKRRGNAITPL
jgi:hypothetical protein